MLAMREGQICKVVPGYASIISCRVLFKIKLVCVWFPGCREVLVQRGARGTIPWIREGETVSQQELLVTFKPRTDPAQSAPFTRTFDLSAGAAEPDPRGKSDAVAGCGCGRFRSGVGRSSSRARRGLVVRRCGLRAPLDPEPGAPCAAVPLRRAATCAEKPGRLRGAGCPGRAAGEEMLAHTHTRTF